jgi:hypothetical protein
MQHRITLWAKYLERRFKQNPLGARKEADKLKFRFAKENELSLPEFIEKKVILLQESGIEDEQSILSRVWESLDPVLMATIRPERYYSLDKFTRKVYRQEAPARLLYIYGNKPASRIGTLGQLRPR